MAKDPHPPGVLRAIVAVPHGPAPGRNTPMLATCRRHPWDPVKERSTPSERGRVQNPAPSSPEQVYHEHAGRVYNLARRMLGHEADAEDVAQDVLLQVVRKLGS